LYVGAHQGLQVEGRFRRVIEPRIYRAALVPALLAVLVAMFAVESRPEPLPRGLAADELFDPERALADAEDLLEQSTSGQSNVQGRRGDARRGADQPPGSAQARLVAESFAESDFETRIDRFEDGGRRWANVIGRRAGTASTESQIVVVADRDGVGPGGAVTAAADTAALLELGRALEGRPSRRTVTLVSLAGASEDEAGVRRLADDLGSARVDAVLAVSALGARRTLESPVVPWSNDSTRTSSRLARTAGDAVREEMGSLPGQESVPAQLVRLAFPLGIGAQGVLLEQGIQAVRFSGSGDLPPPERSLGALDRERYGALGRAALRTISALDERGLPAGEAPSTYLSAGRQLVPGWSVQLVAFALLVPALVTVADGFARAGRRRGRVGAWMLWALAGALPFLLAYLLLRLLDLVGLVPGLGVAMAPSAEPLTTWGLVLLAALTLLSALGWLFGRRALVRRLHGLSRPSAPAAGAAVALTVCVGALAVWGIDPLAALFLVPAVHLWSAAAITERPRLGLVLIMAGLVLPLAVAVFYLERLGLDPLTGLWYLCLLVAGGHVSFLSGVLGCVLVGAFCSLVAVLAARAGEQASKPPPPPPEGSVRGPPTYAGPGSLGGTRSALGN
jgi:hypothetical protein